jgi:hypothetical protein
VAVNYNLIVIPLDDRAPRESPREFRAQIVTQINPDQGKVSTETALGWLTNAPLSGRAEVAGRVCTFSDWLANAKRMPSERSQNILFSQVKSDIGFSVANAKAFFGSGGVLNIGMLEHNDNFDNLNKDDFVDPIAASDDLQLSSQSMYIEAVNMVSEIFGLNQRDASEYNPELSKWLASGAQQNLLEMLMGDPIATNSISQALGFGEVGSLVDTARLQSSYEQITQRLEGSAEEWKGSSGDDKLHVSGGQSPRIVGPSDIDIALQSALKHPLLARKLGLLTEWEVTSERDFETDIPLVIQLEIDELGLDHFPTVFYRSRHTSPCSFVERETELRRDGLGVLNEGRMKPRYRAAAINVESQVIKQTLLQERNSVDGLEGFNPTQDLAKTQREEGGRPAEILESEAYGFVEPETSGVTFSAPVDDILTPNDLASAPEDRANHWPCYFFEDLHIGFRIDLRQCKNSAGFRSIHEELRVYRSTLSGGEICVGWTEGMFEREQPADDRVRVSSTEFAHYTGMTAAQAKDYNMLRGLKACEDVRVPNAFDHEVTQYAEATRLEFGEVYEYRVRNVFLGGISLPPQFAGVIDSEHINSVPFYRAHVFSPGEVVGVNKDSHTEQDKLQTVIVSDENPSHEISLFPTPIDVETARFHGQIFNPDDQAWLKDERDFVTDSTTYFEENRHRRLKYYCDPDVHTIRLRIKELGSSPDNARRGCVEQNGRKCDVVEHEYIGDVDLKYGDPGGWRDFRPATIEIRRTREKNVRIQGADSKKAIRRTKIYIPVGVQIEISIVPLLSSKDISKSSASVASSTQLSAIQSSDPTKKSLEGVFLPNAIGSITIRVVHAVAKPRQEPIFMPSRPAALTHGSVTDPDGVRVSQLNREEGDDDVVLRGRVLLDAASTGEVQLSAQWKEIVDRESGPGFALRSGAASTEARTVIFDRFVPSKPTAELFRDRILSRTSDDFQRIRLAPSVDSNFMKQFDLQNVEDTVYLTADDKPDIDGVADRSAQSPPAPSKLPLETQIRVVADVQAVATARIFRGKNVNDQSGEHKQIGQRSSHSVRIDVPATIRPTNIVVSHVLPISREVPIQQAGGSGRQRIYGFRVHVQPRRFSSGPGERVAVACMPPQQWDPHEVVAKHFTQWGEDPIERPGLRGTMRPPRSSDFGTTDLDFESILDHDLYPSNVLGGRKGVVHADSLAVPFSDGETSGTRMVNCAAYALRQADTHSGWYFDVVPTVPFFGFMGLALHGYQPNAINGLELSSAPTWVYVTALYREPVVWFKRDNTYVITVGPVYDPNVSFEIDRTEYQEGVSSERAGAQLGIDFRKSSINDETFFECRVLATREPVSLIRKRFDDDRSGSSVVGIQRLF